MTESLLVAGIVCIVASIVGGGIKLLGAEVPVLNSFARQAMLFAVGAAFLFGSFWMSQAKPAPPANLVTAGPSPAPSNNQAAATAPPLVASPGPGPAAQSQAPQNPPSQSPPHETASQPSGCPEAAALTCLPRSSAPVTFQDPAAANLAAAANMRDGLSTTQAQEVAVRAGASGKASRLCGIVASNDSSPLGKHMAAIRLGNLGAGDGQATDACLKVAGSFL